MDLESRPDSELISESTSNDASPAQSPGAFFPGSQHFVVGGGVFTSNVTNHINEAAPPLPADFRSIPLGDIDLRSEIRLDNETGMVNRRSGHHRVRRMYTAKIEGRKSAMTVAVYEGDNAEAEWRQYISTMASWRHPNLAQLYGTASASGIHAAILYDELLPFDNFLDLYCHSHFATVYVYAYCNTEFHEVRDYVGTRFQETPYLALSEFWVRRSTGRLCREFTISGSKYTPQFVIPLGISNRSLSAADSVTILNGSNLESLVISSLTLQQYYHICDLKLMCSRPLLTPRLSTLRLQAILSCSSSDQLLEDSSEIAYLSNPGPTLSDWKMASVERGERSIGAIQRTKINGWTRYNSSDVLGEFIECYLLVFGDTWLAQAHHIFKRLQITSNYEDYVVVNHIWFHVYISGTPRTPPEGYLFLCPTEEIRAGPSSFRWPDCPAYWSLDPTGVERLTAEEAGDLGFSAIELVMGASGLYYDEDVYAGLRKFHQAKGFDPESQDVALHLGYPLYQLSDPLDIPFAHFEEEDFYTEDADNGAAHDESVQLDSQAENGEQLSRLWSLVMLTKAVLILFLALHNLAVWIHV